MAMFYNFTVYFILTISVALSAPVQRVTRQQSTGPIGAGSDDIIVPQYVLDLYRNLSKEDNPKPLPTVEYNTVRSFENTEEGCAKTGSIYTFKFDTTAINKQELIFKAFLRIYLATDSNIDSDISLKFLNGTVIKPQRLSISTSQWLEFQVAPAVEEWLRHDSSEMGFQIDLGSTVFKPSCDENLDNVPLLVVYSYDTGDSFLKSVEKAMEERINDTESKRSISEGITFRNTRSSDVEKCGITGLSVSKEWINTYIYNKNNDYKMYGPDSISINSCGGSCSEVVPLLSEHSSIIYLLKSHEGNDYNRFKRCCVPVKYNDLYIMIVKAKEIKIFNLKNLSVKSCECIYTRLSDHQLSDPTNHPVVV